MSMCINVRFALGSVGRFVARDILSLAFRHTNTHAKRGAHLSMCASVSVTSPPLSS